MPAGPLAPFYDEATEVARALVDHACTHPDDRPSWTVALAELGGPFIARLSATPSVPMEAGVQLLLVCIIEQYVSRLREVATIVGVGLAGVVRTRPKPGRPARPHAALTAELWNMVLAGDVEDALVAASAVRSPEALAEMTAVSLRRGLDFIRSVSAKGGFPSDLER